MDRYLSIFVQASHSKRKNSVRLIAKEIIVLITTGRKNAMDQPSESLTREEQLGQHSRRVALLLFACWTAEYGSCQQVIPAFSPETQQHIEHVKSGLLPDAVSKNDPHPGHPLGERMAALHIPGVSIAVIHHGVIEWAEGFGVTRLGGPPVTAETMFQAGSISKPIAAMAALRLVQQEKLSLDTDVNTELSSWKLPVDPSAGRKPVTLRQLLTHTGGISVHGFDGYAFGAPVPDLIQVLNGESPANSPAIRSEALPGSSWKYSGGGYTIMQQVLIDVTHEAFPKLLKDSVLTPIGMTESTYEQPLPADRRAFAATPYDANGTPVVGGAHTYPEMAPPDCGLRPPISLDTQSR